MAGDAVDVDANSNNEAEIDGMVAAGLVDGGLAAVAVVCRVLARDRCSRVVPRLRTTPLGHALHPHASSVFRQAELSPQLLTSWPPGPAA